MKLFLPKQHGAWAMLLVPFWLGVIEAGFIWEHLTFFVGWVLLYLATYPILLLFKKKKTTFYARWGIIYLISALIFLAFPIVHNPKLVYFGIIIIPFFAINAYFSAKNNDRALLNDFSAIFVFSLAGFASAYVVNSTITSGMLLLFTSSLLFFIGSTFYVKTMIREKKNVTFKWISWTYHLLVPIAWVILGENIVATAFVPSLFRSIYFYGKPLSAKKVGIYEIVNSVIFFFLIVYRLI